MNILASFPLYSHPEIAQKAFESLNTETIIICNNKELVNVFKNNQIINETNNYCNGAWNQAMKYFLKGNWELLALSSSDVIMSQNWKDKIPKDEKSVFTPTYSKSLELLEETRGERKQLTVSIGGAFSLLPRKAVEIIYPIPEKLKLWFGDEFMYTKLLKNGWKIIQAEFTAFHYTSLSIGANEEANKIIEQDKKEWGKIKEEI